MNDVLADFTSSIQMLDLERGDRVRIRAPKRYLEKICGQWPAVGSLNGAPMSLQRFFSGIRVTFVAVERREQMERVRRGLTALPMFAIHRRNGVGRAAVVARWVAPFLTDAEEKRQANKWRMRRRRAALRFQARERRFVEAAGRVYRPE